MYDQAFQDYIMRAVNTDNKITQVLTSKALSVAFLSAKMAYHNKIETEIYRATCSVYIYINERQEEFEFAIDLHTIGVLADRDYCFTD